MVYDFLVKVHQICIVFLYWLGRLSYYQTKHFKFLHFSGSKLYFFWNNKKQPIVSRSSTEASIFPWLLPLLKSQGSLISFLSLVSFSSSPHNYFVIILVPCMWQIISCSIYHFVHEKVALGFLVTQYIALFSQLVDIFTKPLPLASFSLFHFKLRVQFVRSTNLTGHIKDISYVSVEDCDDPTKASP